MNHFDSSMLQFDSSVKQFDEKLGIINSAKDLQDIRELRNEIAHEYSMDEITEIFEDVLKCTGSLKTIWAGAQDYIRDKIPLDNEKEYTQENLIMENDL
jgi:hypothetical protein